MNNMNDQNQNQVSAGEAFARLALVLGGMYVVGSIIDDIVSAKNDTVNYKLTDRGITVYHGICYEDRLDARVSEHERNGFVFDKCIYDDAKPRARALEIERRRIMRSRPKYNIHHNC